jgi:hypothetical protein
MESYGYLYIWIFIPDAPWCWYIYLHDWVILGANVGKYSMEHMGYDLLSGITSIQKK